MYWVGHQPPYQQTFCDFSSAPRFWRDLFWGFLDVCGSTLSTFMTGSVSVATLSTSVHVFLETEYPQQVCLEDVIPSAQRLWSASCTSEGFFWLKSAWHKNSTRTWLAGDFPSFRRWFSHLKLHFFGISQRAMENSHDQRLLVFRRQQLRATSKHD